MPDTHAHPSPRRLSLTWLVLMALTAASMIAGRVAPDAGLEPLGLAGVGLVLAAAVFKSRLILMNFLNLRCAAGSWRPLFTFWLTLIALLILAAYAVALSGALPQR